MGSSWIKLFKVKMCIEGFKNLELQKDLNELKLG